MLRSIQTFMGEKHLKLSEKSSGPPGAREVCIFFFFFFFLKSFFVYCDLEVTIDIQSNELGGP